MKMKIITTPNPLLFKKSKPVIKITSQIKELIKEMILLLRESPEGDQRGIGLAAIQVGQPLCFFITLLKPNQASVFINPEITAKSTQLTSNKPEDNPPLDGCLSIPNIYGFTKRHAWIKLRYQDEQGSWHEEKFTGFESFVLQHEYDHLSGKLFVEKVIAQGGPLYRFEKNQKGEKSDKLVPLKLN